MLNEEKYIRERFGKENHFRVPEGYFDGFADRMRDRIQDDSSVSVKPRIFMMRSLRPLLSAACVCMAIMGGIVYFTKTGLSDNVRLADDAVAHTGSGMYTAEDAVIDYAMMDNTDIYACLISE